MTQLSVMILYKFNSLSDQGGFASCKPENLNEGMD
jgi:hypothetical protein